MATSSAAAWAIRKSKRTARGTSCLLRHEIKKEGAWKGKVFYSLYMHLDAEEAKADAKVRWRRELFRRTKDHVEALAPAPLFEVAQIDGKDRLVPKPGLGAGDAIAVTGGEVAAKDKDDSLPTDWKTMR